MPAVDPITPLIEVASDTDNIAIRVLSIACGLLVVAIISLWRAYEKRIDTMTKNHREDMNHAWDHNGNFSEAFKAVGANIAVILDRGQRAAGSNRTPEGGG